jgi:hypothetical protein
VRYGGTEGWGVDKVIVDLDSIETTERPTKQNENKLVGDSIQAGGEREKGDPRIRNASKPTRWQRDRKRQVERERGMNLPHQPSTIRRRLRCSLLFVLSTHATEIALFLAQLSLTMNGKDNLRWRERTTGRVRVRAKNISLDLPSAGYALFHCAKWVPRPEQGRERGGEKRRKNKQEIATKLMLVGFDEGMHDGAAGCGGANTVSVCIANDVEYCADGVSQDGLE